MEIIDTLPAGKPVDPAGITNTKAVDFVEAISYSEFCKLQETWLNEDGLVAIVFETQVEVPQHPVCDIRKVEQVAVLFDPEDKELPKVLMLRDDFPLLPHQLLENFEVPKSLCLYNIPYDEIRPFWTGYLFLERIREWLKLSAVGQLHQSDQPLERIIAGEEGYILMDSIFRAGEKVDLYHISKDYFGHVMLLASTQQLQGQANIFQGIFEFINVEPQVHGVISRKPTNLQELHALLQKAGTDFKAYLIQRLKEYRETKIDLNKRIVFFLTVQQKRYENDEEVHWDAFLFLTHETAGVIGHNLGIWELDKRFGPVSIIGKPINDASFSTANIALLKPVYNLCRSFANQLNGVSLPQTDLSMACIGTGALGSQLLANLVRAGIGKWTCIDADSLYPHNLARHSLTGEYILRLKAESVASQLNSILPETASFLNADVIHDYNQPEVKSALENASIIVDVSASTSVPRFLSGIRNIGKVCSFFTNPQGNDFVAIGEDRNKNYSISCLEFQYLRFLLHTPELHDHLFRDEKIRYGTGCRDLSVILPQDSIALAASIGSKWLKKYIFTDEPLISIWRTDKETFDVKAFSIKVLEPVSISQNGWVINYDKGIIEEICRIRKERLPNETGGILIGSFDMQRKIIYLVDIIKSPDDSIEYPTAYIRGIKDVKQQLASISKITAGSLQYVGEWHTHPDGCSTEKSPDDIVLFDWLSEKMRREGLPATMLIAGQSDQISIYNT